ncbi:MAG: hypothetical protein AWU57_1659 [Marinobacter sp. T13-3]|nr:MAG: hypothetical protein AWU57_1659 [Marinobacter sp. T13-3]
MTQHWVAQELLKEKARQIDALATYWKRDQAKAAAFIESAKRAILTWQSLPTPAESAIDIRDRASSLKTAANDLNRVLSGASPDFIAILQAHVRDHLSDGLSPAQFSMLEAWQHLSAHHNGLNHSESPELLRIPDILDPLQEVLSLIYEAAGGLEADVNPRPGRNVDHELWLIVELVKAYRDTFGRMPGKSADSPFVLFWDSLKPIIGAKSSYQVVINQVRQLETPPRH